MSLVLSCFFILTSCSPTSPYPTDDTYHFETDSQYTFYTQGGFRNFAETENGYYFSMNINGSCFLFYADKKDMQPIILCNRPNCLHYEEFDVGKRELCTALVNSTETVTPLFYSEGNLYTIASAKGSYSKELLKIESDGSSRKIISLLDKVGGFSYDGLAIHRGYLYIVSNIYDENMNTWVSLWRLSLNKPNNAPEMIAKIKAEKALVIMDLKIYGNHLYFSTWSGERKYYHMNLDNSNEIHQILEIGNFTNDKKYDEIYNVAIWGNQLVTELIHIDNNMGDGSCVDQYKCELYIADLDGSNLREWQDVPNAPYSADNTYFYKWSMWSGGQFLNKEPFLRIYDQDWNLLVDYDPSEYIDTIWDVYISPGEFVFLFTDEIIYYFSKSEIPTGKITPKLFIDMSNVEGFMG